MGDLNANMTLLDHAKIQPHMAQQGPIAPIVVRAASFDPWLIHLVQQNKFYGCSQDDPMQHLHLYTTYCDTIKIDCVPSTTMHLKLFQISLGDHAINGYKILQPRSIATVRDMVNKFLKWHFLPQKTQKLFGKLYAFHQKPEESYCKAWERY